MMEKDKITEFKSNIRKLRIVNTLSCFNFSLTAPKFIISLSDGEFDFISLGMVVASAITLYAGGKLFDEEIVECLEFMNDEDKTDNSNEKTYSKVLNNKEL